MDIGSLAAMLPYTGLLVAVRETKCYQKINAAWDLSLLVNVLLSPEDAHIVVHDRCGTDLATLLNALTVGG